MLTIPRQLEPPKDMPAWDLYELMFVRYRKTRRYRRRSVPVGFAQLLISVFLLLALLAGPVIMDTGTDPLRLLFKLALIWAGGWGLIVALNLYHKRYCQRDFIKWLMETWTHGRPPNCLSCEYDLRGSDGMTCPECGERIPHVDEIIRTGK